MTAASLVSRCALGMLSLLQTADTIEARNAAAGLVMTHGMCVDVTLGNWCGALPVPDGPSALPAQAGRNAATPSPSS